MSESADDPEYWKTRALRAETAIQNIACSLEDVIRAWDRGARGADLQAVTFACVQRIRGAADAARKP